METEKQIIEDEEEKKKKQRNYLAITVTSLKDNPNYVKCPRCWMYHEGKSNFIELCTKCCYALLDTFNMDDWQDYFPEVTADERRRYVEGIRAAWTTKISGP